MAQAQSASALFALPAGAAAIPREDSTMRRSKARHWVAFTGSCLFHASLILLAVQLDRAWVHGIHRPVDEIIRVTFVEPPPLASGGEPKPVLTAGTNPAAYPKAPHEAVVKHSRRPLRDPAQERRIVEKAASTKPERPDDQATVPKADAGRASDSNGGTLSAATTGRGGFASGVPGGLGDSPILADQAAIPPVPLKRVTPIYPVEARVREIEGYVILEVVIDEEGNMVGPIRVKESTPLLDAAAIDALKLWRFSPARDRNGNPVRVILDVPLHFVLD